jgi:RNA polymerase sigma-70 factor, ECF subfamily
VSRLEAQPAREAYAQPEEERRVIEALRAGDEAEFARLVSAYGPAMLRVALMHVSSRAVAEETVQDAWLGALAGLDRFEGRCSLKTWVFSILVNKAKTRGARERRTIAVSALAGAEQDDEPAVDPARFNGAGDRWHRYWTSAPLRFDELPEERLLANETVGVARAAIAALPDPQRTVITLRDVEGWDGDEVCAALELTPGNQRVLLHRARSKVRRALEDHLASS